MHVFTIKAAVLRDKNHHLEIESIEMEGPRDDEVLVRIAASGICRTDIDFIEDWAGGAVVLWSRGCRCGRASG